MNDSSIGGRLRQIRDEAQQTQAAFAADLGLHFKTYSNYEAGNREITLPALIALHRRGIDITWLVTGEDRKLDTKLLRDVASILFDLQRAAHSPLDTDRLANVFTLAVEHSPSDTSKARAYCEKLFRLACAT